MTVVPAVTESTALCWRGVLHKTWGIFFNYKLHSAAECLFAMYMALVPFPALEKKKGTLSKQ